MNTTSSKQHLGAGKSKLSNGEAEVFVLPPNLLEKLGIKLDNIESTVKGPNDNQNIDFKFENEGCVQENKVDVGVTTTSDIQNTHLGNESSILETASLMKKSVFLSPTFVPTIANAIPGEVEISSTLKISEGIINQTVYNNHNTELEGFDYNLLGKHQNNQILRFNDVEQQGERICQGNNKEIINESINKDKEFTSILLSAKEKQNKPKNKINIVSEQIVNLPKLGQSLKSKLGKKNGLIPVTVNTIITPKNCHGLDSENKIIEELPRLINTNDLDSKHSDNVSKICQNKSRHQIDFQTDTKVSVLDQTIGEINISNDLSPSVILTNNVNETREITGSSKIIALSKSQITECVEKFTKEGELLNTDNLTTFYSTNNDIICNNLDMSLNNNTIEDMNCDLSNKQTPDYNGTSNFEISFVNDFNNIETNYVSDEIIKYGNSLDRAINETPNNIADLNLITMCEKNISNDKHLENQTFENVSSYPCLKDSEYLLVNSGNGLIKSKSCIQGVEKPGGDKKESKRNPIALKTYVKKRTNRPNINLDFNYELDLVRKSYKCIDYEIEPTKLNTTCKTHNYCMCEDFGKLTYYDHNDAYEHIHFWQTESVTCESKLVFDMYSDVNQLQDDICENRDDDSFLEKETSKICWNGIFDYKSFDTSTPTQNLLTETSHLRMTHLQNIETLEINTNHDIEIAAGNINTSNLVAEINQPTVSSLKDANIEETKIIQQEQIILNPSNVEIKSESYSLAHKEAVSYTNALVEESQNKQHLKKSAEVKIKEANISDGYTNKTENDLLNLPVVSEVIEPLMGVIHTVKIERVDRDTTNHIKASSKNENNSQYIESSKIMCSSQNVSNVFLNNTELPIEQEGDKSITIEQSNDFVKQLITENKLEHLKINDEDEIRTHASKGKRKTRETDHESEKLSKLSGQPRKKDLKCGICNKMLAEVDWECHVSEEHDYLAWKAGDTIDFKDQDLLKKIKRKLKEQGVIKCSLCNIQINKYKNCITHVQQCIQSKNMSKDIDKKRFSRKSSENSIKCGVCKKEVNKRQWIEHISKKHNYLAWDSGDQPLDLNNEDEIIKYLRNISRDQEGLTCSRCNQEHKHSLKSAANYLQHIKSCKNVEVPSKVGDSMNTSSTLNIEKTLESSQLELKEPKHALCKNSKHNIEKLSDALPQTTDMISCMQVDNNEENQPTTSENIVVKCGVCLKDIQSALWTEHTMKEHNYLAWKDGEPSLNLDDDLTQYQYLYALVKKLKFLVCGKCGIKRKYARSYLDHCKNCDGKVPSKAGDSMNTSFTSDIEKTLESSQLDLNEPKYTLRKDSKDITETLSDAHPQAADMITCIVDESNNGNISSTVDKLVVKCGVCQKDIENSAWTEHIMKEHNYLAWKDGEPGLDLEDEEEKYQYLYALVKKVGYLVCGKCGFKRKYARLFLDHINKCDGTVPCKVNDPNTSLASDVDKTSDSSQLESKNLSNDTEKRKRSLSQKTAPTMDVNLTEQVVDASSSVYSIVKCGVCQSEVGNTHWVTHLAHHNYLAWKEGESPLNLNNDEQVRRHLCTLLVQYESLVCPKCGLKRKQVKRYLDHIKTCDGTITCIDDESNNGNISSTVDKLVVKCGVCQKDIENSAWTEHIMKEHNYLAWKDGEPGLNLEDKKAKYQHLFAIATNVGRLVCGKCGLKRKNAKNYLIHINTCDGMVLNKEDDSVNTSVASDVDKTLDASQLHLKGLRNMTEDTGIVPTQKVDMVSSIQVESKKGNLSGDTANTKVKCGVCHRNIKLASWNKHIMKDHNYLAWKDGEPSLDLEDEEEKYQYLYALVKKVGYLVCGKCGFKRKYARLFLDHINKCDGTVPCKVNDPNTSLASDVDKTSDSSQLESKNLSNDTEKRKRSLSQKTAPTMDVNLTEQVVDASSSVYSIVKCGVCQSEVGNTHWVTHLAHHNYLAWKEGESPLNLNNDEQVRRHLCTLLVQYESLVCPKCGLKRKQVKRYLDHIKTCDGTITCIDDESNNGNISSTVDKLVVKCGVCQKDIENSAWTEHIMKEHNYLAWKDGEPGLNLEDKKAKYQHLFAIATNVGRLVCGKCGLKRKNAKNYLIHINTCDGMVLNKEDDSVNTSVASDVDKTLDASQLHLKGLRNMTEDTGIVPTQKVDMVSSIQVESKKGNLSGDTANTKVKCGVCHRNIKLASWNKHIMKDHNYLAWKDGEPSLDLEDEEEKYQYLYALVKKVGYLVCGKCGFKRKYARLFLDHINKCDGTVPCKVNDPNTSLASDVDKTSDSSQLESKNLSNDTEKRKRSLSQKTAPTMDVNLTEQVVDASSSVYSIVKCGVCQSEVGNTHWVTHLAHHNYLAWKEGESPLNLNNDEQVRRHLCTLLVQYESLVCPKCGLKRKQVKRYLDHIKTCDGTSTSNYLDVSSISDVNSTLDSSQLEIDIKNEVVEINVSSRKRRRTKVNYDESEEQTIQIKKEPLASIVVEESLPETDFVKCGVCDETVIMSQWYDHIERVHNYMAWKDGEPALNLDDKEEVWQHLNDISKKLGGLVCSKCNSKRKYVKVFLEHINDCEGTIEVPIEHDETNNVTSDFKLDSDVKCGVCSKVIPRNIWFTHIQVSHNYMAWMDGEEQLNVNDSDNVKTHLRNILRYVQDLKCIKCGFSRRNAKAYMVHMETCSFDGNIDIVEDKKELLRKNNGRYECAVCHQLIEPKKWREHAMTEHYNIAWVVGDPPIDLVSPYGTEKYLREYWKKFGKLICKVCGERRSSCMGFYVHIITCGKSEEETEMYKNTCEICGNKYLTIYKSQHMTAHREAENAKERKKMLCESKMNQLENESDDEPLGRRKAAKKAQTVIEDYKTNLKQEVYAYNCTTCSFASDSKKRFDSHICKEKGHESNSEGSVKEAEDPDDSGSEASLSESEEYNEELIREIAPAQQKSSWLPFKVISPKLYIQESAEQFCAMHFTNETLFPQWRTCKYNKVPEEQVSEYLPKVQQSCKVKLNEEWRTLKQFEAIKIYRAFSFFTGGSTQCIAWAPYRPNDEQDIGGNYLAVSCHQSGNSPRFNYDEVHSHVGLIQIWHFADFKIEHPKFVLGVAHDYGTIWDMAWCPSGARDKYASNSKDNTWARIGLLAAACSDGNVYIFSVPYPASIEETDELLIVKLKPVAELRLNTKSERMCFQATAISWSKKKGHAIVVVGYSDGTIAYYDVANSSPLVQTVEDEVTIFYPYLDERLLNACVSGLDTMPANGLSEVAICGSSPTGAMTAAAPRGPRVTSHIPAAVSLFAPCWPVTLYAGQDAIINQTPNEVDWSGTGRRVGNLQNCCACVMCGRVVVYNPPVLRCMRLYPPSIDLKKKALGLIDMIPLGKKRKLRNDEYATRMEPFTYEETIDKYGIEFVLSGQNDRKMHANKDSLPERYPLADVTAMAFCPSRVHHNNLALATYSGIVFVILNA